MSGSQSCNYCSSSGPTDTPVHASILYQVYVIYSVRFASPLTVYAKCIFCLSVHSLIKTTFIWVHVHKLQWEDFQENVNSMQSFQLQHATSACKYIDKIRHFCYTGQTAASIELGFSIPVSSVRECLFRKLQLAHTSDLKWDLNQQIVT